MSNYDKGHCAYNLEGLRKKISDLESRTVFAVNFMNKKLKRECWLYRVVRTPTDLFRRIIDVKKYPYIQHLHEVILPTAGRKMHFDIDIPNDINNIGGVVTSELMRCIHQVINDLGCELMDNDISVFSSCGESKSSYHVVVNRYMLPTYEHQALLHNMILDKMNPDNRRYIDIGTTRSTHNLRILLCTKLGSNRLKIRILPRIDVVGDRDILARRLFAESLVTACGTCTGMRVEGVGVVITIPRLDKILASRSKNITDIDSIADKDVERSIQKYRQSFGEDLVYNGTSGRFIQLKRVRPSYCRLCNRVHDKIGAYLMLNDDGVVLLGCYRYDGTGPKYLPVEFDVTDGEEEEIMYDNSHLDPENVAILIQRMNPSSSEPDHPYIPVINEPIIQEDIQIRSHPLLSNPSVKKISSSPTITTPDTIIPCIRDRNQLLSNPYIRKMN